MQKRVIAFLVLTLFTVAAHASWERYQPGKLSTVVAEQTNTSAYAELKSVTDVLITTADFPYRFRVNFTGKRRAVPAGTKNMIRQWAGSLGFDERVADDFLEEIAFVEAGKTYWLAVQKSIQPAMVEELKAGAPIELYALWVGATTIEHVFLVNGFEPLEAPAKK